MRNRMTVPMLAALTLTVAIGCGGGGDPNSAGTASSAKVGSAGGASPTTGAGHIDEPTVAAPVADPLTTSTPAATAGSPTNGAAAPAAATHTPTHDVATAAASTPTPQPPHPTVVPPTIQPRPAIDLDESVAPAAVEFPGCESILTESEYCVTFTEGAVNVLGLDSGGLCQVASTTAVTEDASSLAWRGEALYTCSFQKLIRISLLDGRWEDLGVPCMAVTDFNGELLVLSRFPDPFDTSVRAYRDSNALMNGTADRSYDFGWLFTRMTAHGDRFYGAWHSTDSITVGDLSTGELLGVLGLERSDDWVWGLAVTDDNRLAISDFDRVQVFDAQTGAKLSELDVGRVVGLACTTRHTPTPIASTTTATPATPEPTVSPAPRSTSLPSCEELAQGVFSPGQQANFPPSQSIAKNCGTGGYQSSNYAMPPDRVPSDAPAELHVVNVSEGAANPGLHPEREGIVLINVRARPKPVVLVLSAASETVWDIRLEAGAQLARVVTQGNDIQKVRGVPAGVPVDHRGPDDFCGLTLGWEIAQGGEAYPLAIADIRAYTGLVETSFQGCSSGVEFDVPYWDGDAPDTEAPTPIPLDESIAPDVIAFPGCESVTAERHYCLSTMEFDGGLAVVGLDSGAVCPVVTASAVGGFGGSSLAWRGEALYVCSEGSGLMRVSLRDGRVEIPQVPCSGVASWSAGLLLLAPSFDSLSYRRPTIYAFSSYPALLSGAYDSALPVEPFAETITVSGDLLYGAWHSTDTIDVTNLSTGAVQPPIKLEDYDGWVLGMAVTEDGELVISGDTWGDTVRIFDASTGAKLRELAPSMPVGGLACVTRR